MRHLEKDNGCNEVEKKLGEQTHDPVNVEHPNPINRVVVPPDEGCHDESAEQEERNDSSDPLIVAEKTAPDMREHDRDGQQQAI
ncbi:hypothetical protein GCM10010971_07160 [Silvimonas amylolytica]|uniref:Uncharacterized protein n=1 Tax=Silvimonas amylolytica TaxID=449663 RepID=A0ABQ2PH10_9NEIS|nr:hypothetical protein GCM10010971_07160 [Silvimonas amylolytica]